MSIAGGAAGGAGVGGIFGPVGAGIGAGLGAIGGGILDFFGQKSANDTNWDEFVSNQSWNTQEIANAQQYNTMMSNTAYQRATADMKAAGINPMLAVQNGGASSPSSPITNAGTGAPMQNEMAGLGKALSSALPDALSAAQTITSIKNADQDTLLKGLQGLKAAADTSYANAATGKANEELFQLQQRRNANEAEANRAAGQAVLDQSYQKIQKILDLVGQGSGIVGNAVGGATSISGILSAIKKAASPIIPSKESGGFDRGAFMKTYGPKQ